MRRMPTTTTRGTPSVKAWLPLCGEKWNSTKSARPLQLAVHPSKNRTGSLGIERLMMFNETIRIVVLWCFVMFCVFFSHYEWDSICSQLWQELGFSWQMSPCTDIPLLKSFARRAVEHKQTVKPAFGRHMLWTCKLYTPLLQQKNCSQHHYSSCVNISFCPCSRKNI